MKLLDAVTIDEESGCGTIHTVVTFEDGKVKRMQLEASLAMPGTCICNMLSACSRLANECMARGAPVDRVIHIFKNEHCHRMRGYSGTMTWSCLDAISKAIVKAIKVQEERNGQESDVPVMSE